MTAVSIIVPAQNAAATVPSLHAILAEALGREAWELIVVDDNSGDGTADAVRTLAREHLNVRCIQRIQDRGRTSAVQWGVQAAHGDIVVVADDDLQLGAGLIPAMLAELRRGSDIVSATRPGVVSTLANGLINVYLGSRLADPLTGFFATSRALFLRSIPRMQADGFNIFFDLVYYNRKAAIRELALPAGPLGHTGLAPQLHILWALLCDVLSKLSAGLAPPRLVSFVGVGVIGSSVHFSVLYASLGLGALFWVSQALATVMAMIFNFSVNNVLTYSSDRLRSATYYKGLFLYTVIASFGIVANVSTAQITYQHFKAHTFVAASMGILIDVVWRFVVSNRLIWGRSSVFRKTA
jgi:dolichol-phosphate mannosyltransferase